MLRLFVGFLLAFSLAIIAVQDVPAQIDPVGTVSAAQSRYAKLAGTLGTRSANLKDYQSRLATIKTDKTVVMGLDLVVLEFHESRAIGFVGDYESALSTAEAFLTYAGSNIDDIKKLTTLSSIVGKLKTANQNLKSAGEYFGKTSNPWRIDDALETCEAILAKWE